MKKVLYWNVALLSIFFVLLELFFGQWFSSNDLHSLYLLRNVRHEYDVNHLYYRQTPIIYTRDQYGFRGVYEDLSLINILTVGGSTTDQRYLDDQETWQAQLVQKYKNGGIQISVINAGIDGQSTVGHIKNFDYWFPLVPHLKADIVLVYVGINDMFSHDESNDDLTGRHTIRALIKSKSAFYRLYKMIYGTYLARYRYVVGHRAVRFDQIAWTHSAIADSEVLAVFEKRVADYKKRLEFLLSKIKSFGATPIYVTQPTRFYRGKNEGLQGAAEVFYVDDIPVNGVDLHALLKKINDATLEVCFEQKIMCFDWATQAVISDDDYYDYIHQSPVGAEKFAEFLYESLGNQVSNR